MKEQIEYALFREALRSATRPGTIIGAITVDLPFSNGSIRFCIIREDRYGQPVAQLQRTSDCLIYIAPPTPKGILLLPPEICRYIKHTMKLYGIPHVRGIGSEAGTWERPLQETGYLN